MPRFSERIGAVSFPRNLQVESIDEALRNSLWNAVVQCFDPIEAWDRVTEYLARLFYKIPVDDVPASNTAGRKWVRQKFFEAPWHEVYDTIEFLVQYSDLIRDRPSPYHHVHYLDQRQAFLREINLILERELSGYRFINGVLAPITDQTEIQAIEEAGMLSSSGSLAGAATHIRTALQLLGRKPSPDYRNSIKESISAVEAVVNSVAGADGNGVAKAVDQLAQVVEIHPALRGAMKQLYGFTSDANGIRHALLEQSTVGFAEAKFMLVACSAFTSFVATKASEARLLK